MLNQTLLSLLAIVLLPIGTRAININNGDVFGTYSVPTGTQIYMYGGSVTEFDITGGTVSMYGGTLGGLNTGFDGGSISIYGGTINNAYFGGYSSTDARFYVQSVSFNGSPIALLPNQFVGLPNNFGGDITGVLSDGHNFSVSVDGSLVRPTILFSQPVPEPASFGVLGLGGLIWFVRRKMLSHP